MALRLRVVSEHRRSLGDRSTIVFGVGGGTIGRSADNDWVLPDPHRYISSRHARIQFRSGQYLLEDLSTNGLYVNDREQPLGRGTTHRLRDGDLLRLGEYELLVTIDAATDFPPDPDALVALDVLGAGRNDFISTDRDLGASINMEVLLNTDDNLADSIRAVNAFGQAVTAPFGGGRPRTPRIERDSAAEVRRASRPARAVRSEPPTPAATPLPASPSGIAAFCRGAGIEPGQVPVEAQAQMLQLAGQLLREALVGLKDLERCQQDMRNRFRIEPPEAPQDEPFTLTRGGVDDLLGALLGSAGSRRVDAVQWLRDRYRASKEHEQAGVTALRAAFVEFISRLDPAELESRFERARKRGVANGDGRAKYWDLYADFYRSLTEMPPEQLPHVYAEAYAREYLASLEPPPKSGSD